MNQRAFPKTGWETGIIGMGCWNIGGQWGDVDDTTALETLNAAFDAGINFFDTADAYGIPPGRSEELVGRFLKGRREKILLATKVGNWARRAGHRLLYTDPLHVKLCCDASLYRLKTDVIDLYQCHIGDLEDPTVFLEAFEVLKTEGKIKAYGISTMQLPVLERFNRDGTCGACQLEYSLVNRKAESRGIFDYCHQNQIATIIRGPLAMGILSGKYTRDSEFKDTVRSGWNDGPAHEEFLRKLDIAERAEFLKTQERSMATAALQFVAAHPAVTVIIPGAKSPDQVRQNASAGEGSLSEEEILKVRQATADALQDS
ncbi:MAG: aldo/keto reductase [Planctomycetota bacterium]|nr:aldo/keto reductase [Planctomycetota bacterium]